MANLNETFEKPEFDWSAISVGNWDELDHYHNYFANKENNSNLNNENRQQQQPLIFSNSATPKVPKIKREKEQPEEKQTDAQEAIIKPELVEVTSKEQPAKEPELAAARSPVQQEEQQKPTTVLEDAQCPGIPKIVMNDDIENMPEAEAAVVTRNNLRMQWSPINGKNEDGAAAADAAAAAAASVPKAYAFKDLYECNRQQARRRQAEEDRQARQFHSRPMPNFKAMHKRIDDMVVVHRITVPRTPQTVKYWQACVERRRDKNKEEDEEEPVQPHTRHRTFNLHADQRVRDRRDFDSAVQERQVQKKKEVNK